MQAETLPVRSPGPGRPREFDIDEALDRAVQVFCKRGFHATSVTDLAQAMDLTAGSIYKAFKDKRAVFIAALERQTAQRGVELANVLEAERCGRDKLRRALMFYADLSCGATGRMGCLVVGTAVELAAFDADVATRVVGSLKKREKLVADLIRLGQADGSVNRSIDVKATARCILCLMQGLRVVGKTSATRADMVSTVDVAMKMLA